MPSDPNSGGTSAAADMPMTTATFTDLGQGHVAYIKKLVTEAGTLWAIHAANGEPLAVMESRDVALSVLRQNDLEPTGLH
jgi:hypothetical protein